MKLIQEIIDRKRQGIDCTENESAEVKGYIRSKIDAININEIPLFDEVIDLFQQEYGEVLDELLKPNV